MASFEEHCSDCERILGQRCENVNRWIDEEFKRFGPLHRFSRHHSRGVQDAELKFGPWGRKAALVHILKDCGHIPTARDWAEQRVDSLGMDPTKRFNGYWDPHEFDKKARELIGV